MQRNILAKLPCYKDFHFIAADRFQLALLEFEAMFRSVLIILFEKYFKLL